MAKEPRDIQHALDDRAFDATVVSCERNDFTLNHVLRQQTCDEERGTALYDIERIIMRYFLGPGIELDSNHGVGSHDGYNCVGRSWNS
jgi:hypothetical protein